ncbi:MAG: molybdopterin converting factor subunit 1 [Rhodocyclaceae bacterium]|nr:molybdopterin converting factor subunit 1 [Rhodocyclaceae bacterium]
MVIKVLYFASLREAIGMPMEIVPLPSGVTTVGALLALLAERHPELLTTKNLRCAVNQTMATKETGIADGDEVAFFPPVTGG